MVDDIQIKTVVGWSMIIFIFFMLAFNLFLILIDLTRSITQFAIKIYRKIIKRLIK